MKTVEFGGVITQDDVATLLASDDVNALGEAARDEARRVSGDRVFHGALSPPEDVTDEGYHEVRLSDRDGVEPAYVDAFVGAPDDSLGAHREAHADGVSTDVSVAYGDGALPDRLDEVRELSEDESVRGVVLYPTGTTTAYTDLKAVAVARLYLDVALVRVARDEVGDKLAQTAIAYGANDLGFAGEGEHDAELVAREAGYTPINRAERFGENGAEGDV